MVTTEFNPRASSDIFNSKRTIRSNIAMKVHKEGNFCDIRNVSLELLTADLFQHWDDTYLAEKFPPCPKFQDEKIDKAKNRHIHNHQIHSLLKIMKFVDAFEEIVGGITVDCVWLLKKSKEDDGFQKWHQDMKFRISTTIVVNVGIATVSPSQVSEVNKLLSPICDGSMRKRKQTDQFGQPRGDMTNADDTTKKLKPAATVARSESSLKDLGTLKCYVCGADVWPKHGLWIGSHCVEEMDHVCDYCKKLVKRQKQDRLEKWESVKDKIFDCDSSGDEEEDAEESLVPMETKLIPSLLGNVYLNPYLLGNVVLAIGVMARIGNRGRATIAGIDLGSTNSAEKDRIDGNPQRTMYQSKRIIRRKIDPTLVAEGRESFHAHEYWRPNRLVSFKTVATPVLFMGRRERKKAPNKTQTNIAKEKKLLWQCMHSRWEAMRKLTIMRPLTAKEKRVVIGATTKGIGSRSEILASQDGDSVQRGSMQTLSPGTWLNDEVINYFLKNCLKSRDIKICAKEPGRRRSHFFSSFFVQTMFDEKNRNKQLRGKYNYENVKSWSKNVPGKDIFSLKYIFFPINIMSIHWTVAVIFMETKRIQYYDSKGKTDWAILEGLLQYVKDEYRVKNGKEMDEMDAMEWKLGMSSCKMDTPQQENGELYLSVLGRDECILATGTFISHSSANKCSRHYWPCL